MVSNNVECTALCDKFVCTKKPPALKIRRQGNRELVWCTWIDEECDQGWCVHSKCAIRKLTQDGKCKQITEPVIKEVHVRLDEPYPDAMPKDIAKKFKLR
ncbi:MAG: hypothetical protein AM325_003775 [Candidatus Thorarchaeota archaeon SMTZ1-45]|nr:MAG: hypothetical protein AM325_05540 [Candidatus Thorarchaeota archaeon SMTZ1-45]